MSEYNAGDTVEARITIRIPTDATREQVVKWAEFQLGFTGGLSCDNPLAAYDLETDAVLLNT